ncbi:MAG: hypothetical protein LBP65_01925 [Puniceicoccales bacterium]|jgi:hypothetical protein|nr:hypothetical protein [Puniceicoccales bacterium]
MAQVRDFLNFPDRPTLPNPPSGTGVGIVDGKLAWRNSGEPTQFASAIPGHLIVDGAGTSYPPRGKLILSGDGVGSILDNAANDATEVILDAGGGGGSGDVEAHVSNVAVEMPAGAVTFAGADLSVAAGVKALSPNGFYSNGTWRSVEITTATTTTVTESIVAAESGILFLMTDGSLRVLAAELYVEGLEIPDPRGDTVWYNPATNISMEYDAAGDELGQFNGVPIADFATDASGAVESVTQRSVVNVGNGASLRYWEL